MLDDAGDEWFSRWVFGCKQGERLQVRGGSLGRKEDWRYLLDAVEPTSLP